MEIRFFLRSAEYMHKEAVALSWGKENQDVEVIELPQDVLDMFAEASANILEQEKAKGETAAKAHEIYTGLMADLGYA